MLLLFNKTMKPLNQFEKKKKRIQKKSVFGATADDFPFDKIFSQKFFFLLHTSFYEP